MSEDRITRLEREAALAERMEAERDAAVSETRVWCSLQTDTAVALEAALKGKAEDETAEVIEGYRVRLAAALARAEKAENRLLAALESEAIAMRRAEAAEKCNESITALADELHEHAIALQRKLDALVAAAAEEEAAGDAVAEVDLDDDDACVAVDARAERARIAFIAALRAAQEPAVTQPPAEYVSELQCGGCGRAMPEESPFVCGCGTIQRPRWMRVRKPPAGEVAP